MTTIRNSIITGLQKRVKIFYPGRISINVDSGGNQLVISINHFGKTLEKGIELSKLDFNNQSAVDDMLKKVTAELDRQSSELSFKLLLKQFSMIDMAYKKITENHWKSIYIPMELSKSVDPIWLDETCTQLFINRLGQNCRAAKKLTGSEIEAFIESELSIGIILRSCILDCLSIAKWILEPKYIQWLAYESFKKLPKTAPQNVKTEFDLLAKYLNPNKIDFRHDKILQRSVNTEGADSLYMYYSKYDHFSLVPCFQRKTSGDLLKMAVEALAYIRQSLLSLINFGFEIEISQYCQLLGVSAVYNEAEKYYRLSLTPLHDLINE